MVDVPDQAAADSPRVLVVDDSPANQDILEAMLKKLGCRVRCASSGREALEALAEAPAELVFMDFQMTGMDGLAATIEIRRREVHGDHVPIIGLTAGDTEGLREPCRAAGMDDILTKPVSANQLQKTLARWLLSIARPQLADLRETMGGADASLFRQAIASYLQEAPQHIDAIEKAIAQGQAEQISREAHILKGSSGYFGARAIQDLCRKIESLAAANEMGGIRSYLLALQEEFKRTRQALEAEVSRESA